MGAATKKERRLRRAITASIAVQAVDIADELGRACFEFLEAFRDGKPITQEQVMLGLHTSLLARVTLDYFRQQLKSGAAPEGI